ncbi:MAG TPA: response regulator [Gaiellaceae bacterium]|nr:response regulator [Gaiellaceae bacterium]
MPDKRKRDSAPAREPADEDREWLTLGQAAAYLGAAQSTVRKWADGSRLPTFYTPGGHRRFRRSDLDAFLAGSLPAPAAGERRRVLVVDDDAGLRAYLRTNLELEGYDVREAASAQQGLAALEDELPDVVLLDVMMPEVDGWNLLRRVRERHGVEAIPVIMYSGELEQADDAAQRGAQAFLGKPFDPARLLEAAKQVLGS